MAEPDAPDGNMVPCCVVIPIGALQKGCCEDEQQEVVPLTDTPQK
jgi:hypothetical protein